jgi:hypothetical protein
MGVSFDPWRSSTFGMPFYGRAGPERARSAPARRAFLGFAPHDSYGAGRYLGAPYGGPGYGMPMMPMIAALSSMSAMGNASRSMSAFRDMPWSTRAQPASWDFGSGQGAPRSRKRRKKRKHRSRKARHAKRNHRPQPSHQTRPTRRGGYADPRKIPSSKTTQNPGTAQTPPDPRRPPDPLGSNRPPAFGTDRVQTKAPWISQFDRRVPNAGPTACYRAVATMASQVGVRVPASISDRMQVATGEDRYGRVRAPPERIAAARNYIDNQLTQGRPVAVGVSHARANHNEGITDHFVLVTGKNVDEQGRTYYTFHDPATVNPTKGANPNRNRLYVDPGSGNLVKEGQPAYGYVVDRRYEMSMVVPSA